MDQVNSAQSLKSTSCSLPPTAPSQPPSRQLKSPRVTNDICTVENLLTFFWNGKKVVPCEITANDGKKCLILAKSG